MKECENCISSEICDWEENENGGRATSIYWCERLNVFCDEVTHCQYLDICSSDSHFKVTVEVPHGDEYPMRFPFTSVAAAEHWIKKK